MANQTKVIMASTSGPKHSNSQDLFATGAKLLDKFETQWKHLHNQSEQNVSKAKLVVKRLNKIEKTAQEQMDALNTFITSYKAMNLLEQQVGNIERDIKMLESTFDKTENLLIVLKNHRENCDLKKFVEDSENICSIEIAEKKLQSEMRREKLKLEHLARVQAIELEQQKKLDERRKILEETIREEKEKYLAGQMKYD